MEKFNEDLNVPLLTGTERTAIAFDYVSTFITKTEKLSNTELLMLEGKITYYLQWVNQTDKVIASFLKSIIRHIQNILKDRADQEGITPTI